MGQRASDFRYRLCLTLGWPHPDYLLECLTGEQLAGWVDYTEREPFGFPIEDTRGAMTMMTIVNSQGGKTSLEDFELADKLRETSNAEEAPDEDDLMAKLRKLFPPAQSVQQGPPPEGK